MAGQESPVTVMLTPRVRKGKVAGKITDDGGKPVAGTIHFVGPETAEAKADENGVFSATLTGGSYDVRVDADHFFGKSLKFDVADGKDSDLSASVRRKPVVSRVTLRNGKVQLKQPVTFKGTELSPTATGILDELADALISHPEVKRIHVETHWDASVPADQAKQMTDQQAQAIAAYLIRQGVPPDKIEVAGMGAEKPIVPNIGIARFPARRRHTGCLSGW
jgi:outer membrane protein OmpA-like peptidoglycan-associated protein